LTSASTEPSAKTHDDFRGVPGTFDKAVAGLKNCVEADLCVCIATTVGKNNMAELPAIIDLAEEIHAERFTYFNFIPTGRGKAHADQDFSPQEREEVHAVPAKSDVGRLQNHNPRNRATACRV
jgi:MoaA/NifB/PqqE/SkfB family radical SAM enzyme